MSSPSRIPRSCDAVHNYTPLVSPRSISTIDDLVDVRLPPAQPHHSHTKRLHDACEEESHYFVSGETDEPQKRPRVAKVTEHAEVQTETSLLLDELEQNLLCPICHDIYHDPHFLACGHTFCHGCLWNFFKTKEAEFEKSPETTFTLHCPLRCEGGIESPPKPARELSAILETFNKHKAEVAFGQAPLLQEQPKRPDPTWGGLFAPASSSHSTSHSRRAQDHGRHDRLPSMLDVLNGNEPIFDGPLVQAAGQRVIEFVDNPDLSNEQVLGRNSHLRAFGRISLTLPNGNFWSSTHKDGAARIINYAALLTMLIQFTPTSLDETLAKNALIDRLVRHSQEPFDIDEDMVYRLPLRNVE